MVESPTESIISREGLLVHTIMTEEVWVQLYIGKDKSGRVFPIEIASLSKDRINDLADAVYEANGNSLGHCNAAQLVVYKAGTELPRKEEDPLDPWTKVPTDTIGEKPLCVVAPANVNQQGKNLSCFHYLAP
jgi:hypothetical protein